MSILQGVALTLGFSFLVFFVLWAIIHKAKQDARKFMVSRTVGLQSPPTRNPIVHYVRDDYGNILN